MYRDIVLEPEVSHIYANGGEGGGLHYGAYNPYIVSCTVY